MKILWVTPFVPDASAGHAGGQAVHRWISAAAQRHTVTLVCRVEPADAARVDALRPGLRAVHALWFARPSPGALQPARIAGSYLSLGRLASRLLRAEEFDLVHVDWLETGLGLSRRGRVPRVAVAIDELGKPARRRLELAAGPAERAMAWLRWRAAIAVQRRVCRGYDAVLAMSEQDRSVLAAVAPDVPMSVLPFPVALDGATDGARREAGRLLFVGAMNRDVNIDAVTHFCRDVLPRVRKACPGVRLTIAGAAPDERVRRLANGVEVEVTGFVPDLAALYRRASVFVSPLRVGGGIISKNLEAMAAGCAVVTSAVGNEGIGAIPGRHVLVAEDAEGFADAVIAALRDDALRARLAEQAREFVRSHFGVERSAAVLEAVHADVVAAARATRR